MEPKFLSRKEEYTLDSGREVTAHVIMDYDREKGLFPEQVVWVDGLDAPIEFTTLPFHEQVYLLADLNKTLKRHCESYFEQAFAYFELDELK